LRTHSHKVVPFKGPVATQALKKLEQIAPKAPRDLAQELSGLSVECYGAGHSAPFEVPLTKKGAETILAHLDHLKKQA